MSATDSFKAGRLQEAVDQQIQEVKSDPADHAKRLFLFELFAFGGDLERAKRQIDAIQYDELELEAATLAYRKVLDSETARRRLFRDGTAPQFLREPTESVRLRLEAVNRLRENRLVEAAQTLARAAEKEPPVRGLLNQKSFDSLRDCDDVFGPVLEVMAQGNYYWVPLEHIDTLAMNPPKHPRDLLWVPARLEVRDGPAGDVFLPALYPFSHEHSDDLVKLGRMTDWKGAEREPVQGVGLRTFLVGDEAITLLEWRELQIVS
jgi:type VI secretion system protein ImpE